MPELYLPSSVRTGGVALPAAAEDEVLREQKQMAREMDHISGRLSYYNGLIKELDPDLSIVLAKPRTSVEGLKPGYYHIVRMIPGHPAYIKPVQWDDGTWRDLDSSVLELAAEDDLWNDRRRSDRRQRELRKQASLQRDRERAREDRIDEINARIKSMNSTQIRITRELH